MSEWRESKLGDVVLSANTGLDAIRRAPIVENDTGIKCLRIQDISQKKDYSLWGNSKVKDTDFIKAQLKTDDIIMARTCSPGLVYLVRKDLNAVFNNGLAKIRPNKEKTFSLYLYYLFKTPDFIGHIYGISGGTSVQLNMQLGDLLSYTFLLPPLPEQRAIASVLSSLDDKIDLLHRQNKTLEAMAETLFRQWFVEEADEGWEEGKLSQYVDIGIGRTPPRQEHEWFSESETDIKWISIKDLGNDGTYIFKTAEYLTRNAVERFNIPVIPSNTVVLSFKMTVGRVAITTEEMLSNEAIAHFKFKCDTPFSVEYLYFYLKTYQYDSLGSTSSIVTAINSAMIKDLTINLPDENKMTKFSIVVQNIFEKVKTNKIQIRTLEKLRDTLLPKLMAGEVRVDYKKEAAGEY